MVVVVLGARPDRQKVPQVPWEVVAAVRIDGLEQPKHDPDVDGEDLRRSAGVDSGGERTWRLPPLRTDHRNGPPMVPMPRMRISSGCAYSAASPNGAENSWCSLWIRW